MAQNVAFFDGELRTVLVRAGLYTDAQLNGRFAGPRDAARKHAEEVFHDEWAAGVDVTKINVRRMNEACTAPEMRCIRSTLGDLKGRTLLDVGLQYVRLGQSARETESSESRDSSNRG